MQTSQAIQITHVTIATFLNTNYPTKFGNEFTVEVLNNSRYQTITTFPQSTAKIELVPNLDYKIINCNYENLKELIRLNIITFPLEVAIVSETNAIIIDKRIPETWLNQQ